MSVLASALVMASQLTLNRRGANLASWRQIPGFRASDRLFGHYCHTSVSLSVFDPEIRSAAWKISTRSRSLVIGPFYTYSGVFRQPTKSCK